MKQHVRTLWVIITLVACQPISGAADGTAVVVTRLFATPSLAANQSSQVEVAITASALHTTLPTRTPSMAATPLIAMETATPIATVTPRPTATHTAIPLPTATPTAFVLSTPFTTIPLDWQIYQNDAYDFAFYHPPDWMLEMLDDDTNETPALFLELYRPGAKLVVGLKPTTAVGVSIACSGTAAGEFFEGGTTRFLGQDVSVIRLIYEDKLKSVFYGYACGEIAAENLVFSINLDGDRETKFEDVNLDPTLISEVSQILATFQLLGEP